MASVPKRVENKGLRWVRCSKCKVLAGTLGKRSYFRENVVQNAIAVEAYVIAKHASNRIAENIMSFI